MNLQNTDARWGLIAQVFHWGMFLLIVGAWFAVEAHEDYPKGSDERLQWMLLHKSLGLSVFFLVWLRIGARLTQPTPAARGNGPMVTLSKLVVLGLYALMIALPLGGMIGSQFAGRPAAWFGVFEMPTLVGENEELAELAMEAHEAGFALLMFLLVLHVAGALKHHFVAKDDVLKRMLPWGK